MKKIIIVFVIIISQILVAKAQNGLQGGDMFMLKHDSKTISVNVFENNKIKELKRFSIAEKSIYTTNKKTKVAIIDTTKNCVILYDFQTAEESSLLIPYEIKVETILLNDDNLFVGGEMVEEMLIQYHLATQKWHALDIPKEIKQRGKAVDDLVVNDSLLIAIDNIVIPKYAIFYHLNANGKLQFSHFEGLKMNGTYEQIASARITSNYVGLLSITIGGSGVYEHITIYKDFSFESSFAISNTPSEWLESEFYDFILMDNKLIVAHAKKGLGILEIKPFYFKNKDLFGGNRDNIQLSSKKIKYTKYKNIISLTVVPNTNKIVLTLENENGVLRHEVVTI